MDAVSFILGLVFGMVFVVVFRPVLLVPTKAETEPEEERDAADWWKREEDQP